MEKKTGAIKKFFGHPFIQFLGPTGVIAVITWFVTKAAQLPPWQIWTIIVFVTVCAITGVNQVETWRQRRKRLMQLSDKAIRDLVYEWVDIRAWSKQPLSAKGDTQFRFQLKHGELTILVARNAQDPRVIDFIAGFQMEQPKTELTRPQWNILKRQIQIELCRKGIQHEFDEVGNKSTLKLFDYAILDDNLTEYKFRAQVMSVILTLILVKDLVHDALEHAKNVQPNSGKEDCQTQ